MRLAHAGAAHTGTPSRRPNSREAISREIRKSGRCLQIHGGLKGSVTSAGAQRAEQAPGWAAQVRGSSLLEKVKSQLRSSQPSLGPVTGEGRAEGSQYPCHLRKRANTTITSVVFL